MARKEISTRDRKALFADANTTSYVRRDLREVGPFIASIGSRGPLAVLCFRIPRKSATGMGLGDVSFRKKNVRRHAKAVKVAGTAHGRK